MGMGGELKLKGKEKVGGGERDLAHPKILAWHRLCLRGSRKLVADVARKLQTLYTYTDMPVTFQDKSVTITRC